MVKGMKPSQVIKTSGKFNGKSNKLGGGGRSAQLKAKGLNGAEIAAIGRNKYGNKGFAKLSAKGKK
jgi:hypothetical protein